jgi:hypothetical protein
VQLETAHTRQGTDRGTDLSRKIGESGQVNTQHRRIIRKLLTRQLHTIAAIAGKLDNYIL